MNYQLVLPGFNRYFRTPMIMYLEKIRNWAVALYLIERGDNLYLGGK